MYEIIKNVIISGRFELSDMLKKIDTVWIQGGIDEEQRTEVIALARENAIPENSYSIQKQLDTLFQNQADMAARILALEGYSGSAEPEEYPEWKQPTGTHDAYNIGDKVTYKGVKYICQMDDCVWSPDAYPDGWAEMLA